MAEKIKYVCQEKARLLYSSVTQKSAPRNVPNATPKFSMTVGIGLRDFDAIIPIMVQCITSETGGFTGNPEDYYLACMSGNQAAARVLAKAELDCMGKPSDEAFKIKEKAEKRAAVYRQYPGILQASSQFDVELARLDAGKIVDIKEPHLIAQAGKDLFYPGAWVAPSVSFQGFRRKSLDAKDGVTGFLQNMLFLSKGEKIDMGGGATNSDIFGGFANYSDYDPTAMAPGGGQATGWGAPSGNGANAGQPQPSPAPAQPPAPIASPSDPARPVDAAMRHDNGDGSEQWFVNGAWDGQRHPLPVAMAPASALPPINPAPAPGAALGGGAPAW